MCTESLVTMLAEAWVHQFDPFAIRFSETLGIRWYGLSYALGFFIGWLIFRWMAKTRRSPLTPVAVSDFLFAIIIGVLLGGRLGYVLFYNRELAWTFDSSFPWWGVFAINDGGMSSHGGMIGFILACIWFGHRRKLSKLHLIDLGAFVAGIGLSVGRVANFINAELKGRVLPEEMQDDPPWWSVKFPNDIYQYDGDQLVQLAPAAQELGIAGSEWMRMLSQLGTSEGNRSVRAALEQIVLATQDGNQAVIEALRPFLTAYYPSQIIQAITDGPIVVPILALIWLKPRKPGVIGAWFLTVYGILRILSETVRQPDVGVELLLGLSRGQVLSVLMIAVGIPAVVICSRRDAEIMPSLGTPQFNKSSASAEPADTQESDS